MVEASNSFIEQDDTPPLLPSRTEQYVEILSKQEKAMPSFLDHFGTRDLKVFFRCWVAAWTSRLLMFINPTLDIWHRYFLRMLIIPPSGVVMVQTLGAVSLFLRICLAWGWGVIAMKASHAVRLAAETAAKAASLQEAVAQSAKAEGLSGTEAAKHVIFSGHMLDTRVVTINSCMLCVFIYLMARLRAANPKTALTALFGIIISDIFVCYGPLLPTFVGTIPLTLVKPTTVGIGIGVACSILLFPQSTSYIVLNDISDAIDLLKTPLAFTALALGGKADKLSISRLRKTQEEITKGNKKIETSSNFLALDFSVGSWGAQDVLSLKEPLSQLMARVLSLLEFHLSRMHGQTRSDEILQWYVNDRSLNVSKEKMDEEKDSNEQPEVGGHQQTLMAQLLAQFRAPGERLFRLSTIQVLVSKGCEAVNACLEGFGVANECIDLVNRRRWFNRPSSSEKESLVRRSNSTLDDLHQVPASLILEISDALVEENRNGALCQGDLKGNAGSLIVVMVFEEHLTNVIDTTIALLSQVSAGYAASWVVQADTKAPGTDSTHPDAHEKLTPMTAKAQEELRKTLKIRPRRRSSIARCILGVYHWFTSSEGLWCLIVRNSTIKRKAFWGLIMGQTSLLVYMADFTFSVMARVVATISGGALGLAAWYIGSGSGQDNPYRLSAVMAVMLIIFMWLRLYLPPHLLQGGIMSGATFLLVVAYSYADKHIPQYGNPGVGYNVFWRRLLLVLCGVAASTFVQVLPRPPSATRHICTSLSNSVSTILDHYSLTLSCWGRSKHDDNVLAEALTLQLTESLTELDPAIVLVRYEFSSSKFDSETLSIIQHLCHGVNLNLGRLLVITASLPQDYQDLLARQTGLLDHHAIGDVMAVLATCQEAPKTGNALPEILPSPLVRRALEYRSQEAWLITEKMLHDESWRQYCVALSAYLKFLWIVDELTLTIKGVVGEAHIVWHKLAETV
ncbi:uncharacterized protein KD926_011231 [Aspergillus affinis]|uniref:uncharacterized protein n=1 Tax=Aspergillus affinis TaxID=1070780 RepID=UPI0022FED71A|nr:uncharacterized protein KD926_011231 [Aspergillus affinis]KAI9038189.1 hypothetical protein KD926_011231 [Aspergillus affinis]